ncbi:MAG: DUF11 domain-containing protein [Gammaproteobacteria bacterium]|nr:DUF11 domain-containing protein [Gammaproteobacteria bacterium]
MKAFSTLLSLVLLVTATAANAANQRGLIVSHHEVFDDFTLQRSQKLTQGGAEPGVVGLTSTMFTFDAFGRRYDVELTDNSRLLKAEARRSLSPSVKLYRGQLQGEPGSWARINVIDGVPGGAIWDGEELIAIEGPGHNALGSDETIIFRLSDTYVVPGTMTCGSGGPMMSGAVMYQQLVNEISKSRAAGATHEIEISAIGDGEFGERLLPPNAEADILNRFAIVDGIFSEQLGVQITLPFIEVFTDSAADPFTDETDAGAFIDELSDYRVATANHNSRALTHLYTGKDLDGSTVGIAFSGDLAILCSTTFGVGLREANFGLTTDALIAAHEIGHNFGAPHDTEAGSDCENEAPGFLMEPTLNGSDQFSQCSKDEMQPNIDAAIAASCIVPLPSIDMTIALDGAEPTVLLGDSVPLTFDVTNVGSVEATNVAVDLTLPSSVTFVSVGSTAGSCTNGAGTANCQLGTVAGGAAETVTITSRTDEVGTATFTATVSADTDDDASNDSASPTVTVDPAIDLAVIVAATQAVDVGATRNLSITIDNLATISANNLVVSITADAGLQPDTASWTAGSCTITAPDIDCTATTLGNQATSTITLGLSGQTAGTQNVTMNVSATETDRDTSNNNATSAFTVSDPPPPPPPPPPGGGGGSSDSGGGSIGALFLSLLGLLVADRRRRYGGR